MKQNKSQMWKHIMENVLEHTGILVICTIYIMIYIGFSINQINGINAYQDIFCILDCYVFMMSPMFYMTLIVFPIIITLSFSTKHDFMAIRITKYNSWKQLLKMQEGKILIYSVIYALIFMLVVGIIGQFSVKAGFNWNVEQSYFYMKSETTTNMGLVELLMFLFLMCVIRNVIIQNILLISLWVKNNIIYGIIAVFCIIFFEMNQPLMSMLLKLYSADYYIWSRQALRLRMVYGVLIYCLIGIIIFRFITSNKEVIVIEKI